MADDILSLSSSFPDATEADWLASVEKALKGRGIDSITRKTADGLEIHPLYRESDFPTASDPLGTPGEAPYLRGPTAAPDKFMPWDIRQAFTHPSPHVTNEEILRDLERGVMSIELKLDATGRNGVQITTLNEMKAALDDVRADIATIALDHAAGAGAQAATLLALWGQSQADSQSLKLDFNMDPLGNLARTGNLEGGLNPTFARFAETLEQLGKAYPNAGFVRIDARMVHEAGGSEAQELAALIASAVDTLRRLDHRTDISTLIPRMSFAVALDSNYGIGVAKLRAARRLWARCLDALGQDAVPMRLHATSSARMLTRYDAWTNMLRNTGAAFAAAVGGADIVTIRPFNEALGTPEELGRRIARNTQIIAMEESQLGRVADPTGGAWFTETFADDLAEAAWKEFQAIEHEGGFAASLISGAFQDRIAAIRTERDKAIAKRKVPITGISEFPLLDEITAPVADDVSVTPRDGMSDEGFKHFVQKEMPPAEDDATCAPLEPIRLSGDYEALRDAAAAQPKTPTIFLATLGPLAEHNARADFARNLFAAGGLEATQPPVPPQSVSEAVAAFKASGSKLACICGADARYEDEASETAKALKAAGAVHVWLAGKFEGEGIDTNIFMGCDVLHTLKLTHAELGVK
ncbi:MAG: methylmalonyl-CoA mutase [Alphaproteobacteria bacterium]|nr:methylmalonyl-CoA mutase [Hyphomonas sp.]MBR9806517.1 methylmalonyl-CoA mutase [Alphaproteobacteria bacterium]|tara:strand:+ start:1287 stop:3206 length:1920 start_codon:yes stop_codon:yes gene_type:complete